MNTEELKQLLLKPIADLDLSARTANSLKDHDLIYLADIYNQSERELLRTPDFGRKALHELKGALQDLGVPLGSLVFIKPIPPGLLAEALDDLLERGMIVFKGNQDGVQETAEQKIDYSKVIKYFYPSHFSKKLVSAFNDASIQQIGSDTSVVESLKLIENTISQVLSKNLLPWMDEAASTPIGEDYLDTKVDKEVESDIFEAVSLLAPKDLISQLEKSFRRSVLENLASEPSITTCVNNARHRIATCAQENLKRSFGLK